MRGDRKSIANRSSFAGALLTAAALCGGCSLLLHADPSQCSSDGDCTSRGFEHHVCQAGTCVPAPPMVEAGSEASVADSSIDRTMDAGVDVQADVVADQTVESSVEAGDDSGGEAGMPETGPDAPGCLTNADCPVAPGSPHSEVACDVFSGNCIQLTTDECPFVIGDYSGKVQPPLFLGAFATIPSTGTPTSDPSYLNYQLAISEFTFNGGVPAGPGTGLRMPVVVVCNNAADIHTAVVHLQSDVHVPGIVSNLDAVSLKTAFSNDLGPGSTFVINSFSANSSIISPSLTTNGLLWHMLGQPGDVAPAYAEFFPMVESYVRNLQNLNAPVSDAGGDAADDAEGGPSDAGEAPPLRVATVTANAIDTGDLASAVLKVLQWNGMSVAQNTAAGNYLNLAIDSVLTPPNTVQSIAASQAFSNDIAALLAFRPNIVVSFASSEFVRLLEVLEQKWQPTTDAGAPNPNPFYLIGPYNQISQELLGGFIGAGTSPFTEGKRKRIAGIGVASASDTHELVDYESRFLGLFPQGQAALGQEEYYDAMYFLVYSTLAAGRVPNLGGTSLGQGMLRLLSGVSYDMGPGDMGNIIGALSANGTFSLFGALGPPTFNIATGARIGQGSVYCVSRDVDSGAPDYVYDVLRVGTGTDGGLGGTFPCYSGL